METRRTRAEFRDAYRKIMAGLKSHLGKKVLVVVNGTTCESAYIATLKPSSRNVIAESTQFTRDGRPCGRHRLHLNPALLYTGEISIDYMDGI